MIVIGEKTAQRKGPKSHLAHTLFNFFPICDGKNMGKSANHFSLAIHAYHSFHCQAPTEPKPSTARKGAKATRVANAGGCL